MPARLACAIALVGALWAGRAGADASVERGRYLFNAAGCGGCHTDVKNNGPSMAGGRALITAYGTFFTPNITPDPATGIGVWSDDDFVRAMREGVSPAGDHYYPVFPYPSFTGMTDGDLLDLKAYLFSLPPVARPNRPHELEAPFGWRFLMAGWKWLYFQEGPLRPDPARGAAWNRGAYLVEAVGHCGECHTPRGALGALDRGHWLAGTTDGPEGRGVPNITPDPETGIGKWGDADIGRVLAMGMLPDGDFVGGAMAEAVDGFRHLTEADVAAIVEYLRAVEPVVNRIAKPKPAATSEWE